MVYVIIYGLLAIATVSISLASGNRSLSRLGMVFFTNWLIIIVVYSVAPTLVEASLSLIADTLSATFCLVISRRYKCHVSKAVTAIFITQAGLYGYMLSAADSFFIHVSLNALFVTNALIIISNSIKILISRDRRWHDVKCIKNDRRINSREHNSEIHYA